DRRPAACAQALAGPPAPGAAAGYRWSRTRMPKCGAAAAPAGFRAWAVEACGSRAGRGRWRGPGVLRSCWWGMAGEDGTLELRPQVMSTDPLGAQPGNLDPFSLRVTQRPAPVGR